MHGCEGEACGECGEYTLVRNGTLLHTCAHEVKHLSVDG
jgi:hypothetical protein